MRRVHVEEAHRAHECVGDVDVPRRVHRHALAPRHPAFLLAARQVDHAEAEPFQEYATEVEDLSPELVMIRHDQSGVGFVDGDRAGIQELAVAFAMGAELQRQLPGGVEAIDLVAEGVHHVDVSGVGGDVDVRGPHEGDQRAAVAVEIPGEGKRAPVVDVNAHLAHIAEGDEVAPVRVRRDTERPLGHGPGAERVSGRVKPRDVVVERVRYQHRSVRRDRHPRRGPEIIRQRPGMDKRIDISQSQRHHHQER